MRLPDETHKYAHKHTLYIHFYFHFLLIPLTLSIFFTLKFLSFNQQARKALEPIANISLDQRFISKCLTSG